MDEFKAQLRRDNAMFINPLEFGEEYLINGIAMIAVLDTDLIHERNKRSYAEFAEGVHQGEISLFVERKNFVRLPEKEELITINNRRYKVSEVLNNMGVLELTLIANINGGSLL
ncbi:TPA: sugar transporter [Yersinia enterocolitica]|nr:sugar transporter [Yersinia enterocolitica]